MPMTPKQLRAVLKRLGLTQGAAAEAIGVAARTVRTWLKGTRAIPEPVVRLLQTWLKHPELLLSSRVRR